MFAIFSTVHVVDPEGVRGLLQSERVDLVRRAPGFVAANWLEPVEGRGVSIVIFDSKEHADMAAAYPVPPIQGVTVLSVEVREVFASA